ncbi:MAG: fructosamine kinase family protein [Planctomycetota bacterium]
MIGSVAGAGTEALHHLQTSFSRFMNTGHPTRQLGSLLSEILGEEPTSIQPLHGGCIADVYRTEFGDCIRYAVKYDTGDSPKLDREGYMLEILKHAGMPVPRVVLCQADLLVMTYIENDGKRSAVGEKQLGEVLADLHSNTSDRYGLDCDTPIGPLDQFNAWNQQWARFYAEKRIRPLADSARSNGSVTEDVHERLLRLCSRMDECIPDSNPPSLIHGDLWSGNMLWHGGKLAGLIDPAVYYADPEVELAFIDLMGGVSEAFWETYDSRRPIKPGFRELRCDLYQLYPLLVHAVLFGGGYGASVDATLLRVELQLS